MFEQVFRNIDDVLREEAGCTTELDCTEQTSWMLFLKYLDDLEQDRATEAELHGIDYKCIINIRGQFLTLHLNVRRFNCKAKISVGLPPSWIA